jgi:hypothetical protein
MSHGDFGPQSAAANRFLKTLDRLDLPETVALAAAGGGTVGTDPLDHQVTARAELRLELREIADRAGRLDAVRAIGREVERWAGSTQTWFPAGVAATSDSTSTLGPRFAALPFVLDAAYGVVLADQLRDAELALLLGPWRDLAGDPFEPGSEFGAEEAEGTGDPDGADADGDEDDDPDGPDADLDGGDLDDGRGTSGPRSEGRPD